MTHFVMNTPANANMTSQPTYDTASTDAALSQTTDCNLTETDALRLAYAESLRRQREACEEAMRLFPEALRRLAQ